MLAAERAFAEGSGKDAMKRKVALGLAALAAVLVVLRLASEPPAPAPAPAAVAPQNLLPHPVFIHYYAWYSAPPFQDDYGHWDGGDPARPGLPGNIATVSYPAEGPYSGTDPALLAQQMAWIKMSQANVLIFSWWGQNDPIDARVGPVMDAAAKAGLRVSFQIEPYQGRTFSGIVADIAYLNRTYGSHPAFYQVSRATKYGPTPSPRGVFFVYGPPGGGTFDALRDTPEDSIVLVRQDDSKLFSDAQIRSVISASHADGLYNYGQYTYRSLPPLSAAYLVVYSASPGFDNSRQAVAKPTRVSRDGGSYYDQSWQGLASLKPEAVAVVSFNEWHEDTQIEPARPFSYAGYTYHDYSAAYGLGGLEAQLAYVNRTAFWVDRYRS